MASWPGLPTADEYGADFGKYIALVPDGDLLLFLERQLEAYQTVLQPVDEAKSRALHPPYTWSLRQVVGHVVDCERVFGYRALRLARHDPTPLPSFDERLYMQQVDFDAWPLPDLLDELVNVRRSHLAMLRRLPEAAWNFRGTVNHCPTTARAMAYAIAGHAEHHLRIMQQRLRGGSG